VNSTLGIRRPARPPGSPRFSERARSRLSVMARGWIAANSGPDWIRVSPQGSAWLHESASSRAGNQFGIEASDLARRWLKRPACFERALETGRMAGMRNPQLTPIHPTDRRGNTVPVIRKTR